MRKMLSVKPLTLTSPPPVALPQSRSPGYQQWCLWQNLLTGTFASSQPFLSSSIFQMATRAVSQKHKPDHFPSLKFFNGPHCWKDQISILGAVAQNDWSIICFLPTSQPWMWLLSKLAPAMLVARSSLSLLALTHTSSETSCPHQITNLSFKTQLISQTTASEAFPPSPERNGCFPSLPPLPATLSTPIPAPPTPQSY